MAGATPAKPGDGAGRPAPSTLPFEEQMTACREAALRLLGVRERSEAELRARLRRKGFGSEVILRVLGRLQETGLQDDRRFAERFADGAGARGLSARRIRNELQARGVGREMASRAATTDPGTEEARALDAARKRAGRLGGLPPEVARRRLLAFLARRGYDPDTCARAVSDALGDGAEHTS